MPCSPLTNDRNGFSFQAQGYAFKDAKPVRVSTVVESMADKF